MIVRDTLEDCGVVTSPPGSPYRHTKTALITFQLAESKPCNQPNRENRANWRMLLARVLPARWCSMTAKPAYALVTGCMPYRFAGCGKYPERLGRFRR